MIPNAQGLAHKKEDGPVSSNEILINTEVKEYNVQMNEGT